MARLRSASYAREAYSLRVLTRHASRPVIGNVLAIIDQNLTYALVARFVGARRAAGEELDAEVLRRDVPVKLAEPIGEMLDSFEPDLGDGFREAYDAWRKLTVDLEFHNGIGKVWHRPFDNPPAALVGRRDEIVDLAAEQLADPAGPSVLLVGVHGVGKTTLAPAALERLPPDVVVFEATAAQVNAGAIYIEELEGRVKMLADKLRGQPVVWHLPNLEEAHYAGQHARSPHGMLDAMLPHIEGGALRLVAEVTPQSLERLLSERPRLATAFQVRPLGELDEINRLATAVRSDGVRERKEAGLRAMREPLFWNDPARFGTLAHVECLDRLEAALATVEKLGRRLERARSIRAAPDLAAMVAGRLYVLDRALEGLAEGAPLDVFLRVHLAGERTDGAASELLELLTRMYLDWAERRGMRVSVLDGKGPQRLLAVSGLGCGTILEGEAGIHVLESVGLRRNGTETKPVSAIVEVAPWVPGPPEQSPAEAARAAFARAATPATIVRSYRLEPDPLVRDRVRGYRTGRADRVLAGDFDLL